MLHLENPVRFQHEVKVTIEHGHGNHLANEMSSVAYWYADAPTKPVDPPPAVQRQPVLRDNQGNWLYDESSRTQARPVPVNEEMRAMKELWAERNSG